MQIFLAGTDFLTVLKRSANIMKLCICLMQSPGENPKTNIHKEQVSPGK